MIEYPSAETSAVGGYFRTALRVLVLLVALLSAASTETRAQIVQEDPAELRGVNVEEHLSEKIPLNLAFVDDKGNSVKLADYFHQGKPVIMMLGYYTCPMLCNLVFNGVRDAVKEMSWLPGDEFQMLTVSIDPRETALIASAKKENYINSLEKPGVVEGWAFLTGTEDQSRALADALGFDYYYDQTTDQYAHPAVIFILTESGTISRYFYGIQFREKDLRFALMDASEGKIGNTLDRVILYCYHYDPDAGGYTLFAANLMRLGGAATLAFLAALLGIYWLKERRKKYKTEIPVKVLDNG